MGKEKRKGAFDTTHVNTKVSPQLYNPYVTKQSIFAQQKGQKLNKPVRPASKCLKLRWKPTDSVTHMIFVVGLEKWLV
jgi:hypothetical protein